MPGEVVGRWLHDLDVRRARSVRAVPGGVAVLHDDYPRAHDHNKLSVVADTDGALLARAADEVLGGAGRTHRLVELRTPEHERAARSLVACGYQQGEDLVMTWEGGRPEPGRTDRVQELDLAQRSRAAEADWQRELPGADAETWRQLGARIATVVGAAQATFLGVTADDGTVVARADLYEHGRVAQVEEVMTAPEHRGQGLATGVVRAAVRRALDHGAEVVFLVADGDDWPRHWYARCGFRAVQAFPSLTSTGDAHPA